MDDTTAEILKRFSNSWEQTQAFYEDLIANYLGWERLKPLIEFIENLKEEGGDKHFRLGTSVDHLLISRSVDHGLRSDQKYLRIRSIDQNDFEITLRDGEKIYRQYRINSLDDVRVSKLIRTLKGTLID